jgi:hypothetical protein
VEQIKMVVDFESSFSGGEFDVLEANVYAVAFVDGEKITLEWERSANFGFVASFDCIDSHVKKFLRSSSGMTDAEIEEHYNNRNNYDITSEQPGALQEIEEELNEFMHRFNTEFFEQNIGVDELISELAKYGWKSGLEF